MLTQAAADGASPGPRPPASWPNSTASNRSRRPCTYPASHEGGLQALRSAGPANSPTDTDAQFAVLEEELGRGPATHGFADERWTLALTVIRRRFRLSLSVATAWRLLKRHGWCWQAPARRALERDEHAVELWKKEVWPEVKGLRRRVGPGDRKSVV